MRPTGDGIIDRKEKIEDYVEGVQRLENKQVEILGIISDGLRGLRERLCRYKFQYCQFHQVKTVKHWLTSHPKLDASRELLEIIYFMTRGIVRWTIYRMGREMEGLPEGTKRGH